MLKTGHGHILWINISCIPNFKNAQCTEQWTHSHKHSSSPTVDEEKERQLLRISSKSNEWDALTPLYRKMNARLWHCLHFKLIWTGGVCITFYILTEVYKHPPAWHSCFSGAISVRIVFGIYFFCRVNSIRLDATAIVQMETRLEWKNNFHGIFSCWEYCNGHKFVFLTDSSPCREFHPDESFHYAVLWSRHA